MESKLNAARKVTFSGSDRRGSVRRKGGARRRIRQRLTRLTRLARPHVNAYIGVRPSSREVRLEEGTNQSSEPTRRWDRARGPYETDDVTGAKFMRLGGPAGQGGGESGNKITERVECSSGGGRGGKESFILAKRRGDAMPERAS